MQKQEAIEVEMSTQRKFSALELVSEWSEGGREKMDLLVIAEDIRHRICHSFCFSSFEEEREHWMEEMKVH